VPVVPSAGAVVDEAPESTVLNQREVILDDVFVISVGCAEPGNVSGWAARESLKVRVGIVGILLGTGCDGADLQLPGKRAADELDPLVTDAGSRISGEFECGNCLYGNVEGLGGAVSINVGEEA